MDRHRTSVIDPGEKQIPRPRIGQPLFPEVTPLRGVRGVKTTLRIRFTAPFSCRDPLQIRGQGLVEEYAAPLIQGDGVTEPHVSHLVQQHRVSTHHKRVVNRAPCCLHPAPYRVDPGHNATDPGYRVPTQMEFDGLDRPRGLL